MPVASNRAFDQRASSTMPITAITSAPINTPKLSVGLGAGIYRPRLLRKKVSAIPMLARGPGSASITAKYQKKICSSGGILRKVSI
ncbi:hypothetical protein D9M68_815770 [compost metagenome]